MSLKTRPTGVVDTPLQSDLLIIDHLLIAVCREHPNHLHPGYCIQSLRHQTGST